MPILVFLSIYCAPPKMVNTTAYPWNDFDMQMLDSAKKRCVELYPDDPCVKIFKKFGKKDYSVICGKGNEKH